MNLAEQLREVETALGIRYPPEAAAELSQLPSAPNMTLLTTAGEVALARADMPENLVPFMREPQERWSDYYCFDLNGSRVAVWADHAEVKEWPSFAEFLVWLEPYLSKT